MGCMTDEVLDWLQIAEHFLVACLLMLELMWQCLNFEIQPMFGGNLCALNRINMVNLRLLLGVNSYLS